MQLYEFYDSSQERKYLDPNVTIPMFNRFYSELINRAQTTKLKRIEIESSELVTNLDEPVLVQGYLFEGFRGFPGLRVFVWDARKVFLSMVGVSPQFYPEDFDDFYKAGMIEFPSYHSGLKSKRQLVSFLKKERTYFAHEFTHYLQWLDRNKKASDMDDYDVFDHPSEVEAYTHQLAVDLIWEIEHSRSPEDARKKIKKLGWDDDLKRFSTNIFRMPRGIKSWFTKKGELYFARLMKKNYQYLLERVKIIHDHVERALQELDTRQPSLAE